MLFAFIVLGVLLMPGCVGDQKSEAVPTSVRAPRNATQPDGQDPQTPDLPPGTRIKDGREVERNRTSATYEWTGSVRAMSGFGVQAPTITILELDATVPLELSFNFTHESMVTDPDGTRISILLTVRDDVGQSRCVIAQGETCRISLKRPVEEIRVWELEVQAAVISGVEVPFNVTTHVQSSPESLGQNATAAS